MTSLLINKKLVILPENVYFPFTEKLVDIEDVTIIGLPSTKSITLPRCSVNDDIFGHLAEINRIVISSEDNKTGISFNQIRKSEYKLLMDNELVSEGIIRIVNITEEGYEIELYDKIIDILEELDENLSTLDIDLAGMPFNSIVTAQQMKSMLTSNVRPVVNIREYEYSGNKLYTTINGAGRDVIELEEDLTPVQVKSVKARDLEYAISIDTVIDSINSKYDIIQYDNSLNSLFSKLNLKLNAPREEYTYEEFRADGKYFPSLISNSISHIANPIQYLKLIDVNGGDLFQSNGKYTLNIPFVITITPSSPTYYLSANREGSDPHTNYNASTPNGTYVGTLQVNMLLQGMDGASVDFEYLRIVQNIKLIKGVNTTLTTNNDGEITSLRVEGTFILNLDYYPKISEFYEYSRMKFDFTNIQYRSNENQTGMLANYWGGIGWQGPDSRTFQVTIGEEWLVTRESVEIRTGDYITGANILPKVPIKNFILALVKYFNLRIEYINDKLFISEKTYTMSNEYPLIKDITNIQVLNFNFDKLVMYPKLPSTYEKYEKSTGKKYSEQVINTNYSIRKHSKNIEFESGIPGIRRDVHAYAYDRFMGYYNGGYSRVILGDTTGFEDGIVFGFLLKVEDDIFFTNDEPFEAGLHQGGVAPEEVEFVHTNTEFVYYPSENKLSYELTNPRLIKEYYTFSPIRISGGIVTDSVEFNKPLYNYANIDDSMYSINTTVYHKYFKKHIQDMYNANTHILTVKMFLRKADRFKIYNIQNSNYIISEIVEYDPTKPDFYDVKLLRVNNINNYI